MAKSGLARPLSRLLLAAVVLLGWGFGASHLAAGEGRVALGFGAAAFLLIPLILGKLMPRMPYRLCCVLYAFIILAYDIGVVHQGYDKYPFYDKISHSISGIVFSILGFCIFLFVTGLETPDNRWGVFTICTYALFFSMFLAVCWEIFEFSGYLLTGHDSQHHLDTGVFDTMGDLIGCLIGSLLSVASYAFTRARKIRLLTGAVVEEFRDICAERAR